MTDNQIKLIEPTEILCDEFYELIKEFRAADPTYIPTGIQCDGKDDIPAYIQRTRDYAKGLNLPEPWWVPCSTYWLAHNNRILGLTGLRHHLTDDLKDFGGHIGYSIRPAERKKGYGNLILKLALQKARERNIDRVLITCDTDNIASQRVIKNNGGKLDSESYSEQVERMTQRYWIELAR